MSHPSDPSGPAASTTSSSIASSSTPMPPAAAVRRFTLFYKPSWDATLQREITGTLEEAMAAACAMLRDGTARHINLVETGRSGGVVPHSRIARWCAERAAP